jgi:hypothetical protein
MLDHIKWVGGAPPNIQAPVETAVSQLIMRFYTEPDLLAVLGSASGAQVVRNVTASDQLIC